MKYVNKMCHSNKKIENVFEKKLITKKYSLSTTLYLQVG